MPQIGIEYYLVHWSNWTKHILYVTPHICNTTVGQDTYRTVYSTSVLIQPIRCCISAWCKK